MSRFARSRFHQSGWRYDRGQLGQRVDPAFRIAKVERHRRFGLTEAKAQLEGSAKPKFVMNCGLDVY